KLTGVYYNPNPPDLAVEMMSEHRPRELELLPVKRQHYLAAGTVVWVVRADQTRIEVYEPDKEAVVLYSGDTLTGGEILPGFELEVATLFEKIPE
ncbi:MAG: Uma2 family endonuclease, partial [Chloroflexota bacterium]